MKVELIKDGLWRLLESIEFYSEKYDTLIVVPKGFETDFASVPRLPIIYALIGNVGDFAATVHDFLCKLKTVPRKAADYIFLEALLASGVSKWRAYLMFIGVRAYGVFK